MHSTHCLPNAYKKKWKIRDCDKDILVVQQTKPDIQEKLKNIMFLLIDIPRAGSGNTNNGNTARRFF